jgi:hypothetical protein
MYKLSPSELNKLIPIATDNSLVAQKKQAVAEFNAAPIVTATATKEWKQIPLVRTGRMTIKAQQYAFTWDGITSHGLTNELKLVGQNFVQTRLLGDTVTYSIGSL